MLEDFASAAIDTGEAKIFLRWSGSGPALLLLHGFPQTHLMWRRVAPLLVSRYTIVCADLRGYGESSCPASAPDHAPYTKRAMAADMVSVMSQLGFSRFGIAGHDRGGRVAYRLALDHPQRVTRLAVLDIVPTSTVWDRADARFALAFWPWSLLAQPAPLPERLVASAPEALVDDALAAWGSPPDAFPPEVRARYADALRDPEHVHAICEEFRAAATLDRDHDQTAEHNGTRITCPCLVVWSAQGAVGTWYENVGGPLALWRAWADDVRGHAMDAGHFFPEEVPEKTAAALDEFFASETTGTRRQP